MPMMPMPMMPPTTHFVIKNKPPKNGMKIAMEQEILNTVETSAGATPAGATPAGAPLILTRHPNKGLTRDQLLSAACDGHLPCTRTNCRWVAYCLLFHPSTPVWPLPAAFPTLECYICANDIKWHQLKLLKNKKVETIHI